MFLTIILECNLCRHLLNNAAWFSYQSEEEALNPACIFAHTLFVEISDILEAKGTNIWITNVFHIRNGKCNRLCCDITSHRRRKGLELCA